MGRLDDLRRSYEQNKREMEEFLERCADRGRSGDDKELFKWLCCNLLASQAKWEEAKEAVEYLDGNNRLSDGDLASIQDGLKDCGYRSRNNKQKARWLGDAQQRFYNKECEIGIVDFVHMLGVLCDKNPIRTRNLLADPRRDNHISGLGMKEASHFLRGLGFSHDQLAILDSVILGELVSFGLIKDRSQKLTRSTYLAIEDKVRDWSNNIVGIPLDGLDWLLWRMGRGDFHSC